MKQVMARNRNSVPIRQRTFTCVKSVPHWTNWGTATSNNFINQLEILSASGKI